VAAELTGVAMVAIQTVLFYGVLAFVVWKIVKVENDTKQIRALLAEIKKALEERR